MNSELEQTDRLRGATIAKVHQEEYSRMVDRVREGAGKVFDAIASRGKNAFKSLSDWLEGVFLSRMRQLFENLVASVFAGNAGKGGLAGLFSGVLPSFGGGGTPKTGINGQTVGTVTGGGGPQRPRQPGAPARL